MTVKEFATYTLVCDEPGCDADFVEQWSDGDYSGFASLDDIDLSDRDWVKRGEQHFCSEHAERHQATQADADIEQREADPTPLPPAMFDVTEETP